MEYKLTHPEEARALHEQRVYKDMQLAKELDEMGERLKEYTAEEFLYGFKH